MAHPPGDAAAHVTIRHRHTLEERVVAAAAAPFFVRPGGPWQPVPEEDAPARSASKATWVRYATRRGMDEATAKAHTRDELAAHFSPAPAESTTAATSAAPDSTAPDSTADHIADGAAAGGTES